MTASSGTTTPPLIDGSTRPSSPSMGPDFSFGTRMHPPPRAPGSSQLVSCYIYLWNPTDPQPPYQSQLQLLHLAQLLDQSQPWARLRLPHTHRQWSNYAHKPCRMAEHPQALTLSLQTTACFRICLYRFWHFYVRLQALSNAYGPCSPVSS